MPKSLASIRAAGLVPVRFESDDDLMITVVCHMEGCPHPKTPTGTTEHVKYQQVATEHVTKYHPDMPGWG